MTLAMFVGLCVACGTEDAGTAAPSDGGAGEAASDAGAGEAAACAQDAGPCTATLTGPIDGTFECQASVFQLSAATDQLQISIASAGSVGGFIQCDRPSPIQPAAITKGCIAQIVTLGSDGSVEQLFVLGSVSGQLACVQPLSGALDASLSGDGGTLSVQVTF